MPLMALFTTFDNGGKHIANNFSVFLSPNIVDIGAISPG